MTREEILDRIHHPGIVAIVRSKSPVAFAPLCEALDAGGIRAIEVTMTTPGALEAIHSVPERLRDRIAFGMGTVLGVEDARNALAAGYQFMVTPVMRLDVVAFCRERDVPVACGAFTPTEAQLAYEAGADAIKIFPAEVGGPSYIKSILGPLPHLKIIPTGGVSLETCKAFLDVGCVALGAGGSLVSEAILAQGDWEELTRRARAFVEACRR
ncbi:MAG: bifunctional 4-hydroxy-2-oxoglutarate aldolase/2-dehydro-3-deoxy-phosphogluconate aldolase [Chthonomonadaceae bacterium]|nr:bifunctional 4-hydroxy-2-oxoglutarate aldolase/2-dehydro-3-deoxy-phosphogluconate aldolase [Chthonomonadaceae bacterium]